jgi:hypothetical protein
VAAWPAAPPPYGRLIALDTFYLGTHVPSWLRRTDVPLFVSRRRLERLRRPPRARGRYALDSGGFTELSLFGRWTITPRQYVCEVRRYADWIGPPDFITPMDYMAEPWIVAKTGLSVGEHQRLTLENYLDLRCRSPDLPWIPVLQGWEIRDYVAHAEAYLRAGVDLASLPLVGIGSVCRRQGTAGIAALLAEFAHSGLRLHLFGMKVTGLRKAAGYVTSADSMAWSFAARHEPALPECRGTHRTCANCLRYALAWREGVLQSVGADDPCAAREPDQRRLFDPRAPLQAP